MVLVFGAPSWSWLDTFVRFNINRKQLRQGSRSCFDLHGAGVASVRHFFLDLSPDFRSLQFAGADLGVDLAERFQARGGDGDGLRNHHERAVLLVVPAWGMEVLVGLHSCLGMGCLVQAVRPVADVVLVRVRVRPHVLAWDDRHAHGGVHRIDVSVEVLAPTFFVRLDLQVGDLAIVTYLRFGFQPDSQIHGTFSWFRLRSPAFAFRKRQSLVRFINNTLKTVYCQGLCAGRDSNLRRHKSGDLQSPLVDRLSTDAVPYKLPQTVGFSNRLATELLL